MFTKVVNMSAKIDSVDQRVEQIQVENVEWKRRFEKLEKECSELKDSVEMAHNLLQNKSSTWKNEVASLKSALAQQSTEHNGMVQVVKAHGSQLRNMGETLKGVNNSIDIALEEQWKLVTPIQNMKMKMDEALGKVNFPMKKTIVCQNVWYRSDEDLSKVAKLIMNTTLELPEIKIVKVEQKSGFNSDVGLIKIELESEEAVKEVLRQKRKLRNAPMKELRDIFLRKSKSEEALVSERNQDIILREMGVQNEYIRLPAGHLAKKTGRYNNTRGRGGRGGHGGRGTSRGGGSHQCGHNVVNPPTECEGASTSLGTTPQAMTIGNSPTGPAKIQQQNTENNKVQDVQIEELLK